METYLPIIQTTLADWLQLTIDHPLYAATLVISVWLLTALVYTIKIAGLNKKNATSERLLAAAQTNLNSAEQQRQQAQDELAAITEQLGQAQKVVDTEKQRALNAEQQITQRNQQIASTIQTLASSFDIGERPVPVPENLRADDLWQQHDKIIKQLIERLRTEQLAKTELEKFYQAEKAKLAETEAHKLSLQANLDSQASLVATLQAQTTSLQQQQNDTQRDLTEVLKRHQADLARLLELEKQAAQFAEIDIKPATPSYIPEPEAAAKLQNLFKKPKPPVTVVSEETVVVTAPEEIAPAVITDTLVVLVNEERFDTILAPEPQAEPEIAPVLIAVEPLINVEPIKEISEKTNNVAALKGLYQRFTPRKQTQAEVITAPPVVDAVEELPSGKLKNLYHKFTSKKQPEAEPDESSSLEDAADQLTEKIDKLSGQLKGLSSKFFSKKK